jgi:hypothetical protein
MIKFCWNLAIKHTSIQRFCEFAEEEKKVSLRWGSAKGFKETVRLDKILLQSSHLTRRLPMFVVIRKYIYKCKINYSASPTPQIYFCDHGVIVEGTVSCRDHALIVDSTKSLSSLWSHCIIVEIADHVETTVSLLRLCRRCRVCGVIFLYHGVIVVETVETLFRRQSYQWDHSIIVETRRVIVENVVWSHIILCQ